MVGNDRDDPSNIEQMMAAPICEFTLAMVYTLAEFKGVS
jgi:hypothetical protein